MLLSASQIFVLVLVLLFLKIGVRSEGLLVVAGWFISLCWFLSHCNKNLEGQTKRF